MTIDEAIDKIEGGILSNELSKYQVFTRMELLIRQLQNTAPNNEYKQSCKDCKFKCKCENVRVGAFS